jgi:GGDEF domain-containing protein
MSSGGGGDEFLLLLSCGLEEAREKSAHLTRSFKAALATTGGLPASVGLSVGCSDVETASDDVVTRIREADAAMYRNKQETAAGSALRRAIVGPPAPGTAGANRHS